MKSKTTTSKESTAKSLTDCPCGSAKGFAECCKPYLAGEAKAPTAEKLMRSRYSAFTLADVDYIQNTTDPSARKGFDRDATMDWAKNSEWKGLTVVKATDGGEKDSTGTVEFIARYVYEGEARDHHERGEFKKREGQWYFLDGKLVQAPVHVEEKPGRNDPCTCGSGKKYKKCCGA